MDEKKSEMSLECLDEKIVTEAYCTESKVKLVELVFIKHYTPNSLPLTENSHHSMFVKRLLFLCFIIFSPEIFKE